MVDTAHRLGVYGNARLPGRLVDTASAYGLSVKKTARFRDVFRRSARGARLETLKIAAGFGEAYTIHPADTGPEKKSLDLLLPQEFAGRTRHTVEDVRKALEFLEKPFAAITQDHVARAIAEDLLEEADSDLVFDALTKGFSFEQAARAEKMARGLARYREEDAETLRQNLHAALRFMATDSVKPVKKGHAGHAHHNHHDGCEDIADDMLEEAAFLTDSEVFGDMLPGFRYNPVRGMFTISLAGGFAHNAPEGEKARALTRALWESLHEATLGRYKGRHIHAVHLSGAELEAFSHALIRKLKDAPALTQDVLEEERERTLSKRIEERQKEIAASESFLALSVLKPEYAASSRFRLTALAGAAEALKGLVDNPEMRRIWKKFKITDWDTPGGIIEFTDNLERLRTILAQRLQADPLPLEEAEAVIAEFRDTIAAGRYFIAVLTASLDRAGPFIVDLEEQKRNLALLDETLASSSLSPVKLAPEHIEHDLWSVGHYLGRHTGTEGVKLGRAFREFVDDFGGEVVEFIQKNPGLTAVSIGLLYMVLSNNGGGNQVSMIAPEYAGANAAIDPLTGLPIGSDSLASAAPRVQCHLHIPDVLSAAKYVLPESMAPPDVSALPEEMQRYYRHCLSLDAAMVQLQNTYSILKLPLSTMLSAPDQAADALAALRPADAPPFAFGESFHESVKFFGDFYFVANGYQNLAHAPWFGVAAAMGWKLGVYQAGKKTSALIKPLADAVLAMIRTSPMILPVVLAAAAYGYGQPDVQGAAQGVSGAIAGSVMGGFAGWGLQSAAGFLQKIPELEYFRQNGIAQGITPSHRAVTKAKDLIAAGCPEGLAPLVEELLEKTFSPSADAAPAAPFHGPEREIQLDIGGEKVVTSITRGNLTPLVTAMEELHFALETAPDKMGLDPHDDGAYIDTLKKAARQGIQALLDGAAKETYDAAERLHLTHSLRGGINLLIGAELRQLGETSIYKALTGQNLSRRQKKQLELEAGRERRDLAFQHALQEDSEELLALCRNMGQSFGNIARQPLLVPLNAAYKLILMSKTLLKTGLRHPWKATLQGLSLTAQQVNRLEPKTKGNLIGAGLTAAAAASGVDFTAAAPDGPLQDAARQISSAAGHAAGATTATGLFAVYNFAEDHILIHVGLGYFFIAAAAGTKAIVRPTQKVLRTFITPAMDMLEDIRLPVRFPRRALGAAGRFAKNYLDDIVHYDERYLDNPHKPKSKDSCCGHGHHTPGPH